MENDKLDLLILRLKNPCFWVGVFSVLWTALGVPLETITSWSILREAVISFFNNPSIVISTGISIASVYSNFITSGFSDKIIESVPEEFKVPELVIEDTSYKEEVQEVQTEIIDNIKKSEI